MAAGPSGISIFGENEACGSSESRKGQGDRYVPFTDVESIRLLKLIPAECPEAPLFCELQTQRLSDCKPYEAISYTWGESSNHKTLCLPEGVLKISGNLASALRSFRQKKHPRFLWADAVYIDQASFKERSQ